MKTRTETVIDVSDWDDLVEKTYGRPYSFQQQDGCKERGRFHLTVPAEAQDYESTEAEEYDTMGVSFATWLAHDPKEPRQPEGYDFRRRLWWERNFYPDIQMVANDLHAKGLLKPGSYTIDIDW